MASTLRRSRRRELVLSRSFTRAIRDKVRVQSPQADAKECRAFFANRANSHPHSPLALAFEVSAVPVLVSRPSMIFTLYPNSNPHQPVYPIHSLPPELLVHVFALGSVDDMMFPILVSHVCHSWRAIVLHARSLWRRVSLKPSSNVHMWKERIRRARPCTLDVALASHARSRVPYDIDLVALQMHLLAPHLSFLRSLDIRFDSYAPYLCNAALGPFCRSASYLWEHRSPSPGDQPSSSAVETPKLESLTLRYPQNDDMKEFSLFGGFAPKLTRVTLEGVRLKWLPELFGNLSFLDYTHHGFSREEEAIDEILSILQVSSRIRELKLCICRKPVPFQAIHLRKPLIGDVTLPLLQSLSLRVGVEASDVPFELITVVSRLSVPDLKNLYLLDSSAGAYTTNGVSRSFTASHTFFDAVCRETPLRNLTVEGCWVEPSLLSSLAIRLPLLKSL